MRAGVALGLAMALAVAGCAREAEPVATVAVDPATPAAGAPAAAASVGSAQSAEATASPIGFDGYGAAHFGADEAAVRSAFGAPLADTPPPESPDACYYLLPATRTQSGYGVGFMFEGGSFVRYDVDDPSVAAPGGLAVGMPASAVDAAFPDAVERGPHKYVPGGSVLVVRAPDGGPSRLVLEADAEGRITSWRIGIEPQVHYVEGCS